MIIKKVSYVLHSLNYIFNVQVLGKKRPFIGGLVVNDRCNLQCAHCRVANKQGEDQSMAALTEGLQLFRSKGIRSLFLVGGEPFIWKDGESKIEDVMSLGRKIGFATITIYTNGTMPISTGADCVFVSLDGLRDKNNEVRGAVFDNVLENIRASKHNNININSTINSRNCEQIELFCEFVSSIKNVNGIFFYFHTPYYGMDELYVDIEQKRQIIKRILDLKKRHKILNSIACLKMVYEDNWPRPTPYCCVWDKGKVFNCCRAVGDADLCKKCGYLGYPELVSIMRLYPSSIINALNYIPKGRS